MAFCRAKELPRGALVEYQINLHTGRDASEENELVPMYRSGIARDFTWETCSNASGCRGILFIGRAAINRDACQAFAAKGLPDPLANILPRIVALRVFCIGSPPIQERESFRRNELMSKLTCSFLMCSNQPASRLYRCGISALGRARQHKL